MTTSDHESQQNSQTKLCDTMDDSATSAHETAVMPTAVLANSSDHAEHAANEAPKDSLQDVAKDAAKDASHDAATGATTPQDQDAQVSHTAVTEAMPAPVPAPTTASASAHTIPVHPATSAQKTQHKTHPHDPHRAPVTKAVVAGFLSAFVLVIAIAAGVLGLSNILAPKAHTTGGQNPSISINAKDTDTSVAKAAAQKALPSVVSIGVQKAQGQAVGSGVMLNTDGNILTNYHVVRGAQAVSVTIAGKTYAASVVGSDPSSDIAVIKADLEGDTVVPIEQGDSSKLQVGDWVMSVGSPYGLSQSVSSGIVSSLARNQALTTRAGTTLYTNLIQTDASINPGNSGGALVNEEGKLVGICTLFSSTSGAFSGVGFAIPSNYALSIANKIIKGEKVTHAYIGLMMQTINTQNAGHYKLPVSAGAYIVDTMPDGPAARAGIQKGDIITAVDGHEITSADDMTLAVRSHEVGQTIKVTVQRGKEKKEFDVTLTSDEKLQKERELYQQQQGRTKPKGYMLQEEGAPDSDDAPDDGDDSGNSDDFYQRLREFLKKRSPRR